MKSTFNRALLGALILTMFSSPFMAERVHAQTLILAAADDEDDSDGVDDSADVGVDSGLSNSSTSGGSSGSASTGSVAIPCLDTAGAVVNAGSGEVCKGILPKCSDLKDDLSKKVKNLMQWKIWGYYNGKDVDLTASSIESGKPMANPVCSVVGHKLQNGPADEMELKNQTKGLKASCGIRPNAATNGKNGRRFNIEFKGSAGGLWTAYLQGSYPWLIRRHTYDVLNELKPDLSNLSSVIKNAAMLEDVAKTLTKMKEFSASLSAEAQTSCGAADSNLVQRCTSGAMSINDPAHRICTLVKAQTASNNSALPYMLAYEIMRRVFKQYDETFGGVLSFENASAKELKKACNSVSGTNRKKKLARTGSCFFGGAHYCMTDNGPLREAPAAGKCEGKTRRMYLEGVRSGDTSGDQVSTNAGFAGLVEKLIRFDVCKQKKKSEASICDQVNIPVAQPTN